MGKTIDAWSAGSAAGKVGEHGARGLRLYYLSLRCRGGAGRPRAGRAPSVRLRQHPSRHDLVLLVAGRGRAWRGSGDDREDPQLARRARQHGGEGDAQLHHAGDPGDPARERRQGLSRLAHGGDRADGQGLGRGRLLAAMHNRLALTLAASLAAALHLGATDPPEKPRRIVSLNLCVDELLLRLAEPRNVASVTWLSRDPNNSNVVELVGSIPVNHGLAEEIIPLQPDLVIAGIYTARPAVAMLKRTGTPLAEVGVPKNLAEVRQQIRDVAGLIGEREKGESVVGAMDASLAALPAASSSSSRPRAIVLNPNGATVGK